MQTSDPDSVTESGVPAAKADGVWFIKAEDGAAVYRLGAGQYKFAAKRATQPARP